MTTVARVQIAGFNTNHVSIASVVKAAAHNEPSSDGLEPIAQCFFYEHRTRSAANDCHDALFATRCALAVR